MHDLYYEDFDPDQRFSSSGATVSESQILDFALKYDPQPFHLDLNAADKSAFKGLIAPGMLTMALSFRLWYDAGVMKNASLGSPGIDEMRWLHPVRPGDTVHVQVRILDKRESASKPGRGLVTMEYRVVNQDAVDVMSYKAIQILAKRYESAKS